MPDGIATGSVKAFKTHYLETDRLKRDQPDVFFGEDSVFEELVAKFGGATFCDGLYRICDRRQVGEATATMRRAFAEFSDRIRVFGYDWLGRQFAADYGRMKNGKPQVLLLEIGAGEAMSIPTSLIEFHDTELVEFPNDALAKDFFFEWRKQAPDGFGYLQCVGYKVPLFLGGKDQVENLEIIDLAVYLESCCQLRNKTKILKEGQVIRDIRFLN